MFGDSASYLLEITVLISLEDILTQPRMGVGWVALPSKGPMRGQYICFMEKSQSFYKFSFYTEYFWRLSPYFLDMITLISVTQNKLGVGRLTVPCKGPMRGQYVFLMSKSQSFYMFVFSIISSVDCVSYFIEMIVLVIWKVP